MSKIWPYIASFFAGVAVMAIAALKWFNGDDYNTTVKKLKQKRVQGDAVMSPIVESPKRRGNKLTKEERKAINKAARDAKKLIKNGPKP